MRKSVSLMLSAALTLGSVVSSYAAPLAKKAVGKAEVSAAVKAPAAKGKKGDFKIVPSRSVAASSNVKGLQKVQSKVKSVKNKALRSATAANRSVAANVDLRGSVIYTDSWASGADFAYGLYSVPRTEGESFLRLGATANQLGAGVDDNNGTFYATTLETFWGIPIGCNVTAYDTDTWEVISTTSPDEYSLIGLDMALDPTTGDVYGCFYNEDHTGLCWTKADFETMTATQIAVLEDQLSVVACDKDGQYYAVSLVVSGTQAAPIYNHNLYKVDKTTGELTLIAPVTGGYVSPYMVSGCINDQNNTMLLTSATDTDGGLWELDLTTGVATQLVSFDDNEEVTSLYIAKPAAADKAPAAPTLSVTCENGAMDAQVKLTMPTTLFDGTPAAGQTFSYSLLANGEEVLAGSASAGEEINETVTLTTSGKVSFVAVASNAEGASPKAKTSCYIGKGTPAAPASVTLAWADGSATLTWTAVTASADGGFIDPAAVTYTVLDSEGVVLAENLETTTFSTSVPEPAEFTMLSYSVKAVYEGKTSAAIESNKVALGSFTAPLDMDFVSDKFDWHTVFDANEDGRTWSGVSGRARYIFSSSNDADDWLFSPSVKLEAGMTYEISALVASQSATYAERIEIYIGKDATVDAMTTELVAPTDVADMEGLKLSNYFTAPETGVYHIGFHAVSDADAYYLWINSYSISAPIAPTAPAAVENISVVADEDGALSTTISFKAPSTTLNGSALTGDVKVKVLRDETLVKEVSLAAGASTSFEDTAVPEMGTYTYSFIPANAAGEEGQVSTLSVYVGPKTPAGIEEISMEETAPGSFLLNWEAVTTAADGSALNPDNVTYKVWTVTTSAYGLALDEEVAEISATTYTYVTDPIEQQGYFYLAVQACNSSLGCELSDIAVANVLTGTPYEMPVTYTGESSLDKFLGIGGVGEASFGNAEMGFPAQDGDDSYYAIKNSRIGDETFLLTGKINVSGNAPVVTFYMLPISAEDSNMTRVSVIADGVETEIGSCVNNDEGFEPETWNKVKFSLAQFAGKTVQVKITAIAQKYVYNLYDNIRILNDLNYELVASIAAPARVETDAEFDVTVKVVNDGAEDTDAFTVNLYRNGEVVDTKTNVYGLAEGEEDTYSFKQTLGLADGDSAEYKAVVVYEADENPDNNETETVTVTRKRSTLPTVTGLTGENTADGNSLTWDKFEADAPAPIEYTEDFESGESFAQEFEGWTFVDNDGSAVGGFQGSEIPGITLGESTVAFFLFDASAPGFGDSQYAASYAAYSGDKYLAALFRYDDGTTDDWAISPVLTGDAQTISFFAKSYSSQYPEQIEVWYSTTDTDLASFTQVADFGTETVPSNWTEYSASLPAGAKYFAIRSCATGSFMLMLDNVTYTKLDTFDGELLGYNVYRDGVKINDALLTENSFLDTTADDEAHTYTVTAVYDKGESEFSEPVTIEKSGVDAVLAAGLKVAVEGMDIVVTGADDKLVTINAVDGKTVYSAQGDARVTVAAAIYLVTVDGKTVKVIVK